MEDRMRLSQMQRMATRIRKDIIEMCFYAQSGHEGGSLSIADVLAVLYTGWMNVDPLHPSKTNRDRLVLSKGHTAPALYAALAEACFFPREWLTTSFRCVNGKLQGHPDMKKVPGLDMSSGSLGMGLSAAVGMALAGRVQNLSYDVYCIMGDGEMNEGQIWEAAATAAAFHLDHLIGIVDVNGLQNDGKTVDVKDMGSLSEKWRSFGWAVYETDGHDMGALYEALLKARAVKNGPAVLLLRTVKGKGVSFMENQVEWHALKIN